MNYKECRNCGATLPQEISVCDRCNARNDEIQDEAPGAFVIFTDEARRMGGEMGGLLRLIPIQANDVAYIGWCAGGVFGIDRSGRVIWSDDGWGHVFSVE